MKKKNWPNNGKEKKVRNNIFFGECLFFFLLIIIEEIDKLWENYTKNCAKMKKQMETVVTFSSNIVKLNVGMFLPLLALFHF